jgi:hypothetical protein
MPSDGADGRCSCDLVPQEREATEIAAPQAKIPDCPRRHQGWSCSRGVDHFPCIGQSHAVSPSIFHHDSASALLRLVTGPITLKLQEHLEPTRKLGACRFHTAKRQFVPHRRQSAASIAADEDLIPLLQRRNHGKTNTRFGEEFCDNQTCHEGSGDDSFREPSKKLNGIVRSE